MSLHKYIFFLFVFFLSITLNAQNYENKWTFGIGVGSVLYFEKDKVAVGGAFIDQLPRLTLATYFLKNITLEAGFATSILDTQKYSTFDGLIRYDLGNSSYDNVVPYVFMGGSFIKAKELTPTLNFGIGDTFWVLPHYGINVQLMYKFSENRFSSQFSHLYSSVGLVYSFGVRNMNPRIWNFRH